VTKYAIVTNDLQVAAATKHPQREAAVREFLPRQVQLLEVARAAGVPVIHLQLVVSEDDPRNEGTPDALRFTEGSAGVQILPSVLHDTDLVMPKPKDSGFFRTDLDETLSALGVDTVVISGMQTQICVQTTAADAHFRGYSVVVPSDGVVSSRPEDTVAALKWMADYCAEVMTTEEIEIRLAATEVPSGMDATKS